MDFEYADIVVPLPVSGCYTYSVPAHLREVLVPGCRVVVPFGQKKIYTGVVFEVHSRKPEGFTVKPVTEVLKGHMLNGHALSLLKWMASYYMAAPGEVLKAAMPSSLLPSGRTMITLAADSSMTLSDDERWVMDILVRRHSVYIDKLPGTKNRKSILSIISSLLDKGLITAGEEVQEPALSRDDLAVVLRDQATDPASFSRAPQQKKTVETFLALAAGQGWVKRSVLLRESDAGPAALRALVDKGVFSLEPCRETATTATAGECSPLPLSQAQEEAYRSVSNLFESHGSVLLHGVTSSGKTEIYIHLMEEQLKAGRQVLYMLPEIALTTQIIERLQRHFGERIGIYHSRLTTRERLKVWERVSSTERGDRLNLVLGVRSSVFLPFAELGLIIVDEEHDPSYKQYDPAPRYHARDTAMMLARLHGAKTLLGSATPAVESYYNALSGRYGLVSLTTRFGEVKMPEIVLSDMRYLRRDRKNAINYSRPLLDTVTEALSKREQVILFQNRRGFSPFIICNECGWVHGCPDCSVSYTYHKGIGRMICHYCGKSEQPVAVCPSCGSTALSAMGLGTEKIEEEVRTIFPSATVARMDQDTTRAKGAHSILLSDFAGGATDILIGTQMISKGLDFENLTVVGILDADSMLNFPDFRAHERSFQMMEQVSGRAGRRQKRGRVIIQTSNPAHFVLRQVLKHDYLKMYESQIAEREEFGYPPFTRLIRLDFKHKEKALLDNISAAAAAHLRRHLGAMVLGPEHPAVMQVQKWFIKSILVKIRHDVSVTRVKELIRSVTETIMKQNGQTLRISVDVDPQ